MRGCGYTRDEVLFELGGAITDRMPADGSPWLSLRDSRARWVVRDPDADFWSGIEKRLRGGGSALVWPDHLYWPGSRFDGRRHVYDHAVLLTEIEGGDRLTPLDIDADRHKAYVDSIVIDERSRRAFTRLLDVRPERPVRPPTADDVQEMVVSSVPPLVQ